MVNFYYVELEREFELNDYKTELKKLYWNWKKGIGAGIGIYWMELTTALIIMEIYDGFGIKLTSFVFSGVK